MELDSSSHGYGQLVYHFEWTPKYRYDMFRKPENMQLCDEAIRNVAKRWQIGILGLSVMPDHIHCIAGLQPTMSVSKALNILKGASAYELFRRQPKFRLRYPRGHLWFIGKSGFPITQKFLTKFSRARASFTEPSAIRIYRRQLAMYENKKKSTKQL